MKQPADYQTRRYRTSQVAEAAGISAATLRTYLSRKRPGSDIPQWRVIGKKAAGEGLPHLFSLRDAMVFAVAAKLVELGADPASAFDVAVLDFGHKGDDERDATELFDLHQRGETVLIYWPALKRAYLKAGNDISSLHDIAVAPAGGVQEGALVLILNWLERRVFDALGVELQ